MKTPSLVAPPGSIGDSILRAACQQWQVDDQWSRWGERFFEWWPMDLRQRVWYDEEVKDGDIGLVRVHAETDVLKATAVPRDEMAECLARANPGASLAALVWNQEEQTVRLRSAIWVERATLDQMTWLFKAVGMMQASEAHWRADALAQHFCARRASSSHPTNGPRQSPANLLEGARQAIVAAGGIEAAWDQGELEAVRDSFRGRGLPSGSGDGKLSVGFPLGNSQTAGLVLALDKPHPLWGLGALLRLVLPLDLGPVASCVLAARLNEDEVGTPPWAHFLGSWQAGELPRGWSVFFDIRYPRALQRPGDLVNVANNVGARASWVTARIAAHAEPEESGTAVTACRPEQVEADEGRSEFESLHIVLGPPTEPDAREWFGSYQERRSARESVAGHPYEDFVNRIVASLFERDGDNPGSLEGLLSDLLRTPVRVERHFFGWGLMRGLWCPTISISRGAIARADGSTGALTIGPQACGLIERSLAHGLKLEWVHVHTLQESG
ncbi:MAG: hypothetical protein U0167_00610 [bacterium]